MYAFAPIIGGEERPPRDEAAPARDVGPRGEISGSDGEPADPPRQTAPPAPGKPGDSGESGASGDLGALGDSASPGGEFPAPSADGGGGTTFRGGGTMFRGGRNNVPPRGGTTFRQNTIRRNTNSAALGVRLDVIRGGPAPGNGEIAQNPQTPIVWDTVDVALGWEESLGLDRQVRNDAKDAGDFQALASVAEDLAAGRLGTPGSAAAILATLAHQIGNRDQPAKSPLGMFLAEVGRMRIRACRAPVRSRLNRAGVRPP